jgi:hypothetical protein
MAMPLLEIANYLQTQAICDHEQDCGGVDGQIWTIGDD